MCMWETQPQQVSLACKHPSCPSTDSVGNSCIEWSMAKISMDRTELMRIAMQTRCLWRLGQLKRVCLWFTGWTETTLTEFCYQAHLQFVHGKTANRTVISLEWFLSISSIKLLRIAKGSVEGKMSFYVVNLLPKNRARGTSDTETLSLWRVNKVNQGSLYPRATLYSNIWKRAKLLSPSSVSSRITSAGSVIWNDRMSTVQKASRFTNCYLRFAALEVRSPNRIVEARLPRKTLNSASAIGWNYRHRRAMDHSGMTKLTCSMDRTQCVYFF